MFSGIAFLAFVVAAVLAVVFFAQARSAGAGVLDLKKEVDEVKKAGEADRAALKEAQGELKARAQQLVEAREKLSDARKRGEPKVAKVLSRSAREAELEEDLTNARRNTEEAYAAEAAARKDAAAAKTAADAAKAELSRALEKLREAPGAAAPIAAATAAGADAALIEATRRAEDQKKAAYAKAADLEVQINSMREREVKAQAEARKARGRAETNNKVFLVTKSELEMTKERLAAAERKLWQAGVALPAAAAKERPKATGPASADRPREEKPAVEVVAPAAAPAVAPEAPAPAEAAVVAAAETTPAGGVAPVRRRPQGGAEAKE